MALIKCPECGKEISSLSKSCPNCGCPIESSDVTLVGTEQQKTKTALAVPVKHLHSRIQPKILVVVSVIVAVLIFVVVFGLIIPNQKESTYNQALSLLESGNYVEGQSLLSKIPDYKDATIILEESRYETYVYSACEAIKYTLKNPDSMVIYEVSFYSTKPTGESASNEMAAGIAGTFDSSLIDELHPIVVLTFGGQNGYGGITPGYYVATFKQEDQKYEIYGFTESKDPEDLNANNTYYLQELVTTAAIRMVEQESVKVGSVDIDRVNKVIKDSSYPEI